ncbi:MAG: hypothetical protein ACI9FR_001285 [Cryomorphaceae bacterium]|jgi:hypothetical protein
MQTLVQGEQDVAQSADPADNDDVIDAELEDVLKE